MGRGCWHRALHSRSGSRTAQPCDPQHPNAECSGPAFIRTLSLLEHRHIQRCNSSSVLLEALFGFLKEEIRKDSRSFSPTKNKQIRSEWTDSTVQSVFEMEAFPLKMHINSYYEMYLCKNNWMEIVFSHHHKVLITSQSNNMVSIDAASA